MLIFKCLCCNSNYQKKSVGDFADEAICYQQLMKLMKQFANKYNFCNLNIKNFILILLKDIYLYQYMDNY